MKIIFEGGVAFDNVIEVRSEVSLVYGLNRKMKCWVIYYDDGHVEYLPKSLYKLYRIEVYEQYEQRGKENGKVH